MEGLDLLNLVPYGEGGVLLAIKGFFVVGMLMYVVFAVIVIRQVEMMLKALGGVLKLPIRSAAWLHLIVALVVGLLVVVV